MKTSVAIILTIFAFANARELPNNLKACRRSDPEYSKCLNKIVESFLTALAPGIRSLNILPVDPLAIDNIKIGENDSPVALKQEYNNIKLHGFSKGLVMQDYNIDFDKLLLSSVSINPRIDFVADYKLDGKVLVLPIKAKGSSNITMLNMRATHKIYCEKYVKNGETYLRVKKYIMKFFPEKVILNFGNLAESDKVLGEQLNTFMSENSDLMFKELRGSYEETFGLVFSNIANNIFSHYPFKILFPE